MANKKARQRICYVLPLSNSSGGHRLGVNGLAVDCDHSILYSGGRDGAICAWDLNLNLKSAKRFENSVAVKSKLRHSTKFRVQIEAHTHWVNDIVLADNNTALVSASSDLTVKVWRPLSNEIKVPETIGHHADYVKCLASPSSQSEWVASGGLDRKVCLWDLNGAGKRVEIETRDEEETGKGSVYALATIQSILVSGGPESIVRLWDPRSGKRITKFVGHTDNIRDVLINKAGSTIMTASSDQTIKVWSVTMCRCMHTLTMHNDSVWSLHSDDPEINTFYSGDRSGSVVKTDLRGIFHQDHDIISLPIAQESTGVNKVIAYGDFIWTATSSSSINRWASTDFLPNAQTSNADNSGVDSSHRIEVPIMSESLLQSIPWISTNAVSSPLFQDNNHSPKFLSSGEVSDATNADFDPNVPIHILPQETIEGQNGLVKHKIMNDRRRVLTLDTSGEVLLWDLIKCIPVKSFGKRYLEDVEPEVNAAEAVDPWCSIDTRTGRLAVVLEKYNCFDSELYADELELDEPVDFREDQRINLGKWILRNLFSSFLDKIKESDELFRKELYESFASVDSRPSIMINTNCLPTNGSKDSPCEVQNGSPMTQNHLCGVPEDDVVFENRNSPISHESGDHFSSCASIAGETNIKVVSAPDESQSLEKQPTIQNEADKDTSKETGTFFGKKFRRGMTFSHRKNRSVSCAEKPSNLDEKPGDGSETSDIGEREQDLDVSFGGVIQSIRMEYKKFLQENPAGYPESGIRPSLLNETPLLKLPPLTTVIIQEEASGGCVDLYRGTVATIGKDAESIEERAPMWLGDLLLKNKTPVKDPIKVSFILRPWQDLLPSISGPDDNPRLNANKMLRVKKILAYIVERIESTPEIPINKGLKPEELLDIYCYDQKLPISMTLATLRTHVWKGKSDIILYYKSKVSKPCPNGQT